MVVPDFALTVCFGFPWDLCLTTAVPQLWSGRPVQLNFYLSDNQACARCNALCFFLTSVRHSNVAVAWERLK